MSIFHLEPLSSELTSAYLKHLGVERERPSLEYLNLLINRHQERVPFENYTRILDFHEIEGYLPTIEVFIERLGWGAGGVCWTMARSFGWLLKNLNFEVQYMYMEPGHLCLRVKFDQDYYVDVGYGAPLLAARPLRTSFEVKTSAETFQYLVQGESALVARIPGPQKTLHFTPILPDQIEEKFRQGNRWGQNRFLSMLLIGKYENGKPVRIANQKLQDFRSNEVKEIDLDEIQMRKYLDQTFGMKYSLYEKAKLLLTNKCNIG